MPPRRIGEVERALLHEQYRLNGPVWDIIIKVHRAGERFVKCARESTRAVS